MAKPWKKVKKEFKLGSIIFFGLLVVTFFMTPEFSKNSMSTKDVVLLSTPKFKKAHIGSGVSGGWRYWVDLDTRDGEHIIDGIDYKYLKHGRFKRNINAKDTVTIDYKGENVYNLYKNGVSYMQFESAQFHKSRNRRFARVLFVTGLVICVIPLFFKESPGFKFKYLLVAGLMVAFLVAWITI